MLDETEFAVAVHLIQRRLCGFDIPDSFPNSWRPEPRPLLVVKKINDEELDIYKTVFHWLAPEENGLQNSKNSSILRISLKFERLSEIHNLTTAKDTDVSVNYNSTSHKVTMKQD